MTDLAALALPLAIPLVREFEGVRLRPYLCPAGVPTIGVGATRYPDGRAVRLSDSPITRELAEQMLADWLRRECVPAVLRLCPGADTPQRVAALASFVFNLGEAALEGSTLRKRVNAGDWPAARAEMMRWVMAKGQRLPGLIKRREAEAALLA